VRVPSRQPPSHAEGSDLALSWTEAAAFADGCREHGRRLVFTNGVFDLLHPGHVRYLQESRDLGDALIVGVNSDRSVRRIKGPTRPVNPESDRVEVLVALACVDAAVVFDDETPLAIITLLQPDVLVKGADWGPNDIVGRDVVEAHGGRVVRVALSAGFSTSDLIRRLSPAGA
jgi:D-beta-D-heptose 7-phosphate kinase/D-beta-D-heptose 1-phosphate adenosyltransferase